MKLKTKFTELKKTSSQKQTYQKGELESEPTLLAPSCPINGCPSFFLQKCTNTIFTSAFRCITKQLNHVRDDF